VFSDDPEQRYIYRQDGRNEQFHFIDPARGTGGAARSQAPASLLPSAAANISRGRTG
jgi:hypothetical protein